MNAPHRPGYYNWYYQTTLKHRLKASKWGETRCPQCGISMAHSYGSKGSRKVCQSPNCKREHNKVMHRVRCARYRAKKKAVVIS